MDAFVNDVLPFLWSTDPAAQAVIIVLFVLFIGWSAGLLIQVLRLMGERRTLRRFIPVTDLEARTREASDGPATLEARDEAFSQYVEEMGINERRNITRHVKSIFDAGWSDTRLEIGELNRHTVEQLFRNNTLLKAVVGIFIVIGLLGTLLGLSKALVPLSQIDFSAAATADVSGELQELLEKLKSAFAPSIWGVFLTVVGVLTFGAYLNYVCIPLKTQLERLTLDRWVPHLYPTTPQRMLKTLEEADRQAHENLQAAKKVAEFAESMDDEIQDFSPRVMEANQLLEGFNTSIERADTATMKLTSFLDEFGDSLHQFSGFQSVLEGLIGEMSEHTGRVHTVFEQVAVQNHKLSEQLEVIGTYAEGQAQDREETLAAVRSTSVAAEEALESLAARNEEVYRILGEPITERLQDISEELSVRLQAVEHELGDGLYNLQNPLQSTVEEVQSIAQAYESATERLLNEVHQKLLTDLSAPVTNQLSRIDETLHDDLSKIDSSFRRLESPVSDSVDRVEGIAESFDKNMTRLLRELQQEFASKNEKRENQQEYMMNVAEGLHALSQQQRSAVHAMENLSTEIAKSRGRYNVAQFLRDKFLKNGSVS